MAQALALGWGGGEEYKSGSGMYLELDYNWTKNGILIISKSRSLFLQVGKFAALFYAMSPEL